MGMIQVVHTSQNIDVIRSHCVPPAQRRSCGSLAVEMLVLPKLTMNHTVFLERDS